MNTMKRLKTFIKLTLFRTVSPHFIDRLTGWIYQYRFNKWRNEHSDIEFPDRLDPGYRDQKRYDPYGFLVETQHLLDEQIDYLEFGVASGFSFRWWVEHNKHPLSRFFGFDTFTGLPENWEVFEKGAFSTGGRTPDMEDNRCSFQVGLFQETLEPFLETHASNGRKVIHLDADLYSSTLFVLTCLARRLKSGDILIFDEFGTVTHEFRAFMDFTSAYRMNYKVLGAVNQCYQVAVMVV